MLTTLALVAGLLGASTDIGVPATFYGNYNVTGDFAANGNATVGGNATVTGNVNAGGNVTVPNATMDVFGTVIPTAINPNSYYWATEWADSQAITQFSVGGTVSTNYDLAVFNFAIANNSTIGTAGVKTSSTTQGGRVCYPLSVGIVKSASINYRWRHIFYMPVASDATNPYTALIGSYVGVGSATSADVPFAGPYISYTHGTNGGNWVLGSGVNNTRTTTNSSTAPSFSAWSSLEIRLANGTYTFFINGVSVGTVVDANIATSPAAGQATTLGCIEIFPGGAWTLARTVAIDRSDVYVTGLVR